jgi:hypothetical protein
MIRSLLCAGLFLDAVLAVGAPPSIPPAKGDPPPVRVDTPRVKAGDTIAVPAGRFADVTVDVPAGASVVWRFYPPPVQRANNLAPGRAIFAGEPGKSYVVTAVVIDFAKKSVTDSEFNVEFAGKVIPPDPKPDPKPNPPDPPAPVVTGTVWLVVVEETSQRTPELAAVLGDLAYWQGLRTKDVMFRFYDKDSTDPALKSHLPDALTVGLPALLTMDRGGKILDARKLANRADVDAALKEVGR